VIIRDQSNSPSATGQIEELAVSVQTIITSDYHLEHSSRCEVILLVFGTKGLTLQNSLMALNLVNKGIRRSTQ
jgi:hypothetical protein